MLDLSVIVPTYNRITYLPALLESLARQDYPADRWELIIADDGSTDDTMRFLESGGGPRPANMRAVTQANGGPAKARNHGVSLARGRAVLFLDDDMVASPTLVAEHARAHIEVPWAVCIGHLLVPDEGRDPWVAWEDAGVAAHFEALRSGKRVPGPRDFFSGNCSVAADLFNAVGGYDVSLKRTEDLEIGYRLHGAGANFVYRPNADSLHLGKHSFEGWLHVARTYGHSDVLLAWEKGHTELQREIFWWYHLRQAPNRMLVRLCSALPFTEGPLTRVMHGLGQAAYRRGLRKVALACYSAVYNLAYWMAIERDIGRKEFWKRVRRESAEKPVHETEKHEHEHDVPAKQSGPRAMENKV